MTEKKSTTVPYMRSTGDFEAPPPLPTPAIIPRRFNGLSRKYSCCCGAMQATTGAMTIGILEMILFILGLVGFITLCAAIHPSASLVVPVLISKILWALTLGCLFYGLKAERAEWLLPRIVLQSLSMGFGALLFLTTIVILVLGRYDILSSLEHPAAAGRERDEFNRAMALALVTAAATMAICLALEAWFLSITLAAYKLFKDKAAFLAQDFPLAPFPSHSLISHRPATILSFPPGYARYSPTSSHP